MATLQVKGMDDELYRALGARAALDNRSISQEVVVMIKEFLASTKPETSETTRSLMELAGSWEDERTPAEISRQLRKSRRNRSSRKVDDVFA